jgi:hypothetical protein
MTPQLGGDGRIGVLGRAKLVELPPPLRDRLRRLLVADQPERDRTAAVLLRDPRGRDLAEVIEYALSST